MKIFDVHLLFHSNGRSNDESDKVPLSEMVHVFFAAFCILEFKSNKIDLKSDKVFRQKLKILKKYIYTTENWAKFWVDEEGDK